ncbi:Deoxyribodipyrimidine photo-lyase|nr:Deoxyribodipyrimidine photo-lyase [Neochlamydia sp. AcF84]
MYKLGMTDSTIIWFRQDLRLEDNPALQAALQKGASILPVYIYSPEEEGDWPPGAASRWWLHHSLQSLADELLKNDLHLVIRAGNTQKILEELCQSTGSTSIFWNRRYEPAVIKRDALLKSHFHELGIETKSFNSSLLFEPWTNLNKEKKPFQVFTPFWKACQKLPDPPLPLAWKPSKKLVSVRVDSMHIDELNLLPHIHWDKGIQATWKPGSLNAKKALMDFIKNSIYEYKDLRDRPDLPGVSRLSPYLHFGEISPRTIWHTIKEQCDLSKEGVEAYLRQLGWREFAYHLLYYFPHTSKEPLRDEFNQFPWDNSPDHLKAWQKGQTGYPFVDAGIRQMWEIGWMHNRLRLIVGSFLVKDLLIAWQEGFAWFWDTLVDADLANNTLGWQWVAGCGADAAPYFRIFNPITQGEKFDPNGDFVRKWVPELAALPNEWIHKPWEAPEKTLREAGIELGVTYPKPIVDHAKAREKALAAFQEIKN